MRLLHAGVQEAANKDSSGECMLQNPGYGACHWSFFALDRLTPYRLLYPGALGMEGLGKTARAEHTLASWLDPFFLSSACLSQAFPKVSDASPFILHMEEDQMFA